MSVGGEPHGRVLAGVVNPRGTTVGFTAYVDGHRLGHYRTGRVRMLPVPGGRHAVRVVADGSVEKRRAALVLAEFLPASQPGQE